MNYYELLEVSSAASVEAIKNAYKTLAKKYHPDAYEGDKAFAEEKMKALNEAMSVLEDEEKRREYNMLNGIYQNPEDYGYDGGNNLNINRDANGETIFFSYADELEDERGGEKRPSQKGSFMDTIDDFINNRRASKKTKKNRKTTDDLDLDETLSVDNLDADIEENDYAVVQDISEMPDYDGTEDAFDPENAPDLRTVRFKNKSGGKIKAPRLYYITVACLIPGIIILLFMIGSTFNISNLREIMSTLSGGGAYEEEHANSPGYTLPPSSGGEGENSGGTNGENDASGTEESTTEPYIYTPGISDDTNEEQPNVPQPTRAPVVTPPPDVRPPPPLPATTAAPEPAPPETPDEDDPYENGDEDDEPYENGEDGTGEDEPDETDEPGEEDEPEPYEPGGGDGLDGENDNGEE